MDWNTELNLAHAAPPMQWEDEEKATNELDELREEFRKRCLSECVAGLVSQERKRDRRNGE
jgi:hypothetical protein